MKELQYLNKFFIRYKWRLLLGILFVTASNYFGILIPQKIRDALDFVHGKVFEIKNEGLQANDDQLQKTLLIFGLTVISFMIIKGIFMFLMRQTIIVTSRLIEYDMRKEVYDHLQTLDTAYYKMSKTGDLMARISEDVSKVRNYLGPGILYGINLISLFAMTIYAMFSVNSQLAIYTLIPLPILSLSIYYVSSLINEKSTVIQQQLSKLTSISQEVFSGIRVVKSYGKEDQFNEYFASESEDFKAKSMNLAKINAYFFPLMILLINLSTLIVLLVGGFQVGKGGVTAGNIAEFIIYVNMLTWPVTSIGWIASIIQEAEASQARINQLLAVKPGLPTGNINLKNCVGDIRFDNVSFTYPDTGIQALKNINLDIKSGERVAIVGRTASGKSTLAELLLGMYLPGSGHISIDGNDLRDINKKDLRNFIGYVPQDVFLFSDTVTHNITFGNPAKDQEEAALFAEHASVKEDILRLPQQFDTIVGERGVTLSGGQKQRISIARALIKGPEIVILDDCLSAVDTETEQRILNYLNTALAGKTAIIITHRLSSLADFDRIYFLDHGQIIEQGSHEELMAMNGAYTELYQKSQHNNENIPAA
ncbi:MAG: ABC transporter ATP-binding protein [Saprospiraceae bacterium]|nr:ABC transporter ATP-binding protein [Saprospiraceae bacterium]MBK7787756.1 ABC transporter ATP-binding protein [Saprospiraceae bacterium]MBK8850073.1 ABC transporter ATP-binding protein [Saprospiraceae bacterium]